MNDDNQIRKTMEDRKNEYNKMIEVYKFTALELAKHHKKYCDGENCPITLMVLKDMAEKCGVKFSEEEWGIFI